MGDITEQEELRSLLDSYEQCFNAMGLMLHNRMPMPAIILLYTVIDGMSWLATLNPNTGVRKRYCKWVRDWVLPEHDFEIQAVDLYAARCGVLHTLTYESDLYAKGEARPIAYTFGSADDWVIRQAIATSPIPQCAIVDLDVLIQAVLRGGAKFLVAAFESPQLSQRVREKSGRFFMHLDKSLQRVQGANGKAS